MVAPLSGLPAQSNRDPKDKGEIMHPLSRRSFSRFALGGLAAPLASQSPSPDSPVDPFLFVQQQLARLCELAVNRYPSHTLNGVWKWVSAEDWVAGYFPGMLWKLFAETRDPVWRARAQHWTAPIAAHRFSLKDLDFGLLFEPTFVASWRLTGDRLARDIALEAAASMAKRYMPGGRYIRSWGTVDHPAQQGFIIIDCLIDLDLLFWAAREENNPFFFEIAHHHALTTLAAVLRPDGSTLQVAELDPETGSKVRDHHKQGFSPSSCWSRGQGWGLYMCPRLYRHTRDYRFLKAAHQMARYYLDHSPPDLVPYWDFQAPSIPNEPRDSSAAALAGAGLWDLSNLVNDPAQRDHYRNAARKILDSLTNHYLAEPGTGRVLLHGAYHVPAGIAPDESLIFGDYYYLELLLLARHHSR
jgi:unsaturated chondroitin disaccharide hydrolase